MGSLTRGASHYQTELFISTAAHFLYVFFSNRWDRTDPDQSWIWFWGTWGIPAWTSFSTFFWISSSWSLSWARSFSRVTGSWNRTNTHQTIWDHTRPHQTTLDHVRPHETTSDHWHIQTIQNHIRPYETTSDHTRPHQTTRDQIRPLTHPDQWSKQHAVVYD